MAEGAVRARGAEAAGGGGRAMRSGSRGWSGAR